LKEKSSTLKKIVNFLRIVLDFLTINGLICALASVLAAQDSRQDFIDEQIAARAEVGVGPMTWSRTVAAYA